MEHCKKFIEKANLSVASSAEVENVLDEVYSLIHGRLYSVVLYSSPKHLLLIISMIRCGYGVHKFYIIWKGSIFV